MKRQSEQHDGRGEASLTSLGIVSGFLALIGASCCVLPLVLINLGVSAALVSHLGVLARWQPWLLGLTLVLLAAGIGMMIRRGHRPGPWQSAIVFLAVALVIAAGLMPFFETDLLRWVRQW